MLTISSASPVLHQPGHDLSPALAWEGLLSDNFGDVFSAPSFKIFAALLTAWALCPGRRTLTRLWSVIPAWRRRCYSSYARWVREGRWSMDALWGRLVRLLVQHWAPADGRLTLLLDGTLVNKTGRKIDGAGFFYDSVTSAALGFNVASWGLNVVVIALHVPAPWGGEPLALPILVRLHRKDGQSLTALAVAMLRQLAEWLPDHRFRVVADGGYASLIGCELPRTVVITRLRRNAALYGLTPPRTGRRGRPRLRGERLPSPPELAAMASWESVELDFRGRTIRRLLWARQVLWWETARARTLLIVIVRDPARLQPDQFFITSDTSATPAEVVTGYAQRWPIEDTNRNAKQFLGIHNPQSWVGSGPERVVCLGFWLYSAIWHWYLTLSTPPSAWPHRPWYPGKRTPSFADALATLRRQLWTHAISDLGPLDRRLPQIHAMLLTVLAEAA